MSKGSLLVDAANSGGRNVVDDRAWNAALQEVLETIDARLTLPLPPAVHEALTKLRDAVLILLRPQL
jgi:hypothetical protein